MKSLSQILRNHSHFEKVISSEKPYRRLDFSDQNKDLLTLDLTETPVFSQYVFDSMLAQNQYVGIGGYDENRVIYRQRKHFTSQDNARSVHLGTDIWTDAGDAVFAPLDGEVHSSAFNNHFGDYGPTIILKHELEGLIFYTLYGHLSLQSLENLREGKKINAGEQIGTIGTFPENGDWPPHLHFQIISDMGNKNGDFPGVSSISEREYYLRLCPNPDLILRTNF